jgi:molybdopterin converting factor small subunit
MQVDVRLSGQLATLAGRPRLQVQLAEGALVSDLISLLHHEYAALDPLLNNAVPVISGQHVSFTEPLRAGQEVALLLPVAGG